MKAQNLGAASPSTEKAGARQTHTLREYTRRGLLACLSLLCGCASYSPQPIDPFHEIDQLEQRATESRQLDVVPPGKQEWLPLRASIDLTDGLDLAEANALALFYGPRIRAARSSERVAGAQLLRAGLLSNPELFLGPRVSTSGSDVIFPAGLSWELPLWGKREAEKGLADHRLSVAQLRVVSTELRVLTEVRSAFIRIAGLHQALRALEAQLDGSERVLQWVAALQQTGEVDAVTAYLARLEQDEARAALATTRLELESTTLKLLENIGVPPTSKLSITLDPDPRSMPELPSLSRRGLMRHPEIRTALSEYEAAEATLKLEVARQYPAIRIGPEFEADGGDASVGAGVGIELPLFDRNRGGVAEAEQRREAARDKLASSLLQLSHVEAQARAEWVANERMLNDYRAGALKNAQGARRSLELRLQAGQSNVLEVLAALRALTSARVRELELERESTLARLRAAVAGGAVLKDPTHNDSETEKR
ncbi:MAG: TolC family protein [Planctomycetota bacterium]